MQGWCTTMLALIVATVVGCAHHTPAGETTYDLGVTTVYGSDVAWEHGKYGRPLPGGYPWMHPGTGPDVPGALQGDVRIHLIDRPFGEGIVIGGAPQHAQPEPTFEFDATVPEWIRVVMP